MAFFTVSSGDPQLYISDPAEGEQGWIGYVLPPRSDGIGGIDVSEALSAKALRGSFVFFTRDPGWHVSGAAASKITHAILEQASRRVSRLLAWIPDPDVLGSIYTLSISADGSCITNDRPTPLVVTTDKLRDRQAG